MESNQHKNCYNCGETLPELALYCPMCGQKDTNGRIPLRVFIAGFFESVFDLDSRFFKTLIHIFIPAKLTKLYFEGKHKSYSHPLKLLFGIAVIHMAIIGYVANKYITIPASDLVESKNNAQKLEVYDLIKDFEVENQNLLKNAEVNKAIDSLKSYVWTKSELRLDTNSFLPVIQLDPDSLNAAPIMVKTHDLATLSLDEIIAKYHIKGHFSKVELLQLIKSQENPKSVIIFGLGNLIWMLFVLLTLTAFFMKLLYIRRKFFLIEHLVFLYHWHAVAFVIMSIFLLLISKIHIAFLGLVFFLILLFGFISLKKYYSQGFFKSFVKFALILVFYSITFSILLSITSLISLLIF